MCLHLNRYSCKQLASEDIVCYKRVLINFTPYIGKSFTGIIKGIECEGKIQVDNGWTYFCTNNPFLNGAQCSDRLGYKYSWRLDSNVQYVCIDEINMDNLIFTTPYRDAEVKLGELYTSELIRDDYEIHIGLHSYVNYEDVRDVGFGTVVKCIIPKGAEYYEGEFGPYPSYASNQLKYLEIITK